MLDSFEIYEIQTMPDEMLVHNIRCLENILGNPAKFPDADMARCHARWVEMVAQGASRALTELLTPTPPGPRPHAHFIRRTEMSETETRQIRLMTIRPIRAGGDASGPSVEWITFTGTHAETCAEYDRIRATSSNNVQITLYANRGTGLGKRLREGWGQQHGFTA